MATRCVSCPKTHTRTNKKGKPAARCDHCARVAAADQARRRERLRREGLAKGVCVNCGGERDRPEVQLCAECREINSRNCRAYQRRRSLPRRRRKARQRTKARRVDQQQEQARELADTLLRRLSGQTTPQRPVQ